MKKLKETAAAGATTAHSIAVRTDGNRLGGDIQRRTFSDFMLDFFKGVKNRGNFHQVTFESSIKSCSPLNEASDFPLQINDALSRLKGMQMKNEFDDRDTIAFGIEDDDGNFMKITVPVNQAKEFETKVAQSLAEVQEFKRTGRGSDRSLAELLYELKDQFTILDAEFPTIPKNAIYNAGQIDEAPGDDGEQNVDQPDQGDDDNVDNADDALDDLDDEMDDGMGQPPEGGDQMPTPDDDMGQDFDAPAGGGSKEDILQSVIQMIQSNNEKEIAQYEAEKEKAKAEQMKLSSMRARRKQTEAEEMLETEAEMEASKKQDKEAKRMLDVMKFKKGQMESATPVFDSMLQEVLDDAESRDSIEGDRREVNRQAAKMDRSSPEGNRYAAATTQAGNTIARAKMQALAARDSFRSAMKRKEAEEAEAEAQAQDADGDDNVMSTQDRKRQVAQR